MATIEYWIQIENHAWDACPNNVHRMMGMTIDPNPQPVAGSTLLRNVRCRLTVTPCSFAGTRPAGRRPIDVRRCADEAIYVLDFGRFEIDAERRVVAEPPSGGVWRLALGRQDSISGRSGQ